MASEVKLPRLGQGMEAGTIVKWLKGEGERVEKGEPLYEMDTDKVTQEVEAPVSGVLLRIAVAEGEAPVGTTIAYIGEEGEIPPSPDVDGTTGREDRVSRAGERVPTAVAEAPAETPAAPPPAPPPPATPRDSGAARIKASPLARRLARERGVDLSGVRGTGPEGRVVAEDVERGAAAVTATPAPAAPPLELRPVAPGSVERVELSNVRRTIARRLTEAWQAPSFQLTRSADMSRALALLERVVARQREDEARISVSDLLTKACAVALVRHPGVNALWAEDAIEIHGSADIGLAIAAPNGLIVPVIRGCEQRSLAELAAARADLVGRARAGALTTADLEGGTFTISNLGPFGVERFVAVLNPPQAAILAVGAIEERPVARDGKLEIAPMLELTLTCDHRVVDGALAAQFLASVRELLEEPGLML
jgi:pyruvate dehydrogenase E2 component (dihydrolipoamide acetyltransferase)